jgi:hypothetical protein
MNCPYCQYADEIYCSDRRIKERILNILGCSTYFCRSCYRHFHQFRLSAVDKLEQALRHWLHREVFTIRFVPSRM